MVVSARQGTAAGTERFHDNGLQVYVMSFVIAILNYNTDDAGDGNDSINVEEACLQV